MSLLLDALKQAADTDHKPADKRRTAPRPGNMPFVPFEYPVGSGGKGSVEPAQHGRSAKDKGHGPQLDEQDTNIVSRRTARNVFASKRALAQERLRKLVLIGCTVFAVPVVLALAGYYFHHQRDLALRLDLARMLSVVRRPAFADVPTAVSRLDRNQTPRSAPPWQLHASDEQSLVAREVAAEVVATLPEGAGAQVDDATRPASSDMPASDQSRDREVAIVGHQRRKQIAAALAAGYRTFHAGDTRVAERHYARALQLDTHNRDALLGLAAIALRRGDDQRASLMYRALLLSNHRDVVATAALDSLSDRSSVRARESALKYLLRDNPGAAELHFALGRVYSTEQRWAEARAAFFAALARDNANPDILFNVAVSLDHLGQAFAAEHYYTLALRASNHRIAGFDPQVARNRLGRLRSMRRETG